MEESASSSSINESDDSINKSIEENVSLASSSSSPPVVQLATFSDDTNDKAASAATASITKTTVKKIDQIKIPDFIRNNWDPLNSGDWELEKPTQNCLHRIKKDIYNLYQDPAPGICVIPDDDDITKIHALITGPFDTPYEGGFFNFLIRCPPNYPFKPPRVRLMTTSNGTVRFNPNLYRNGKVCLSILGTWEGPAWLPSQSIASVLMSIQSLMNNNPYFNEPGHETERQANASKYYNDIIKHETIRVAVCENLENEKLEPKLLRNVMESSFVEYFDYYVEACKLNLEKDSEPMKDLLFNEKKGNFQYGELLKRLESIRGKINIEKLDDDGDSGNEKISSLEEEDESKSEEDEKNKIK